ncbi:MAG TPA: mechanosensitive ion channel [Anaerolineales bacterium]|nr:mechanosensitive ion channel [Anaerolineales bacterium]
MQPTLDTVWEALVTGFWNLIAALVIFIISIYLARILSNIVRRMLNNRKIPLGVAQLFSQLTLWAIIVSGLILALQRFFDVTAFLAGLGIAGLAIGFALQDIMKNLAAGVVLLVQQPFHVGESIGVKGYEGTITAIDLRATEMRATDGRLVILPNADVLVNPIINYTRTRQREVELSLNLPLTSEPDTIRRILMDTLQGVTGVLHQPEPAVVFVNMTDSAMQVNFSFWVDVNETGTDRARDAVLLKIKSALSQEGIEIPHPVQAVYSQS